MVKILLALLVLVLAKSSQALWHDVTNLTLENRQPVQLPNDYSRVHIFKLNGTLYKENLSQLYNLTSLILSSCYIEKIENGALCSSPLLKELLLDFSSKLNPPILTKESFENCNQLEHLSLQYKLDSYGINEDALENIPNLKELHLQAYNIRHLGGSGFKLPRNLVKLTTYLCRIQVIEENTFESVANLEDLQILFSKQLSPLPKKLFKSTPNLKKLHLRGNALKNISGDEFEGLINLEGLDLSQTQITSLDSEIMAKSLPKLKSLDISETSIPCKQRKVFADQLESKLKFLEVKYKVMENDPLDLCDHF